MADWSIIKEEVELPVKPERWYWEAHYNDGEVLKQFDDKGRYHEFTEILKDDLKYVMLKPFEHCDVPGLIDRCNPGIMIRFSTGYKPLDCDKESKGERVYCFGFEATTTKMMIVILPDNTIAITDNVDSLVEGL